MKRTGLFILLAGALATPFFLSTGFAQGWGSMHGSGLMGGMNMMGNGYGMMSGNRFPGNTPEKYQLSEKQQQKIQAIRETTFNKIRQFQNQLQTRQQTYSATLNSDNPDDKTLDTQREAIQKLQDKIGAYSLNARKKINKILTDDQLAYFGSGHQFLMGLNGNMMFASKGYPGCSGVKAQGTQSGPRGMMD